AGTGRRRGSPSLGCRRTGSARTGVRLRRAPSSSPCRGADVPACSVGTLPPPGRLPGRAKPPGLPGEPLIAAGGHRSVPRTLFFCARVRHVVVSNSVFTGNRGDGIGGLGDDGDKYNVVTGNVCQANGANGIADRAIVLLVRSQGQAA